MKKIISLTPICIIALSISFILGCNRSSNTNAKYSKLQRFQDAKQHEFDRTHDPELNEIPSERLHDALAYYKNTYYENLKSKTSPAFADIDWKERGPNNVGGRTRAILFLSDKKVLAAGVTGGLWKTEDITANGTDLLWEQVDTFGTASINISCIAQDPNNSNTLYIGTGESQVNQQVGSGIYKSTDGGESWNVLNSTTFTGVSSNFSYISKILVTTSGDVYAATRGYFCNAFGGLMKSTDGGSTWTRVLGTNGTTCSNGQDLYGADIEENDAGDLFFTSARPAGQGRIYLSEKSTHVNQVGDAGNWTNITPTGNWQRIEIDVSQKSGSGVIYAACQGNGSSDVTGIYYSNNKGATWTSRSIPNICDQGSNSVFTRTQAWYDLVVKVDPNDDNTAYLGGIDLLKTTDAGATFTQLSDWANNAGGFCGTAYPYIHADHHALIFSPYTPNVALSGSDGGLFYSTDMDAVTPSWTAKNNGFNVTQYYALATHPTAKDTVIGGTQDNGSHELNSYGIGNALSISGGDGGYCHIHQNNPTYAVSSYVYNTFFLQSGLGYQEQSGSNSSTGRFINPSDLDDANNILFSAGDANILEVRTGVTTGALNRSTYNLGFNNRILTALKVSPNNTDALYVGDNGGNIYKISNRGGTPTKETWGGNIQASGYISSIDVWKSTSGNDDSIVVTFSNYGVNSVFLTADGTTTTPTWQDIDDNSTLQDIPVRWGIFSKESNDKLLIASDLGVLATDHINGNSTNWTMINNGQLPYVRVDMLDYDAEDNLVIATFGRGIWETQQPCNLTNDIPTTPGTYTAVITHNEGTYTCFCSDEGELLLAIDTFGSGAVISQDSVSLQINGSGNTTQSWNTSGGLITNPNGGVIIDRKWNVYPTTQPTNGNVAKVKFQFTAAEYSALQSAASSLSTPSTVSNPNELNVYQFDTRGSFDDPSSNANGSVHIHGLSPSITEWKHTTVGAKHEAEFQTSSINGGGIGIGGNNGGLLPVDWLSFSVHRKSENEAILLWQTASELNNTGYEIQRSYDKLHFIKIDWVFASEKPNQINDYKTIDHQLDPTKQVAYYRLKQIDIDGKYSYSETRKLQLNTTKEDLVMYPNPVKDILNIDSGDKKFNSTLEVYNTLGEKNNIVFRQGMGDVSHLPNGTYFIKLETNHKTVYRKFMILR